MKIILSQSVDRLGATGDVLEVADGYARNFLLPQRLAIACTAANLKRVEKMKVEQALKEQETAQAAQICAEKVGAENWFLDVNAGEDGKLYGSVTPGDVQKLLSQKGLTVEKKKIIIKHPIRSLGIHSLELRLHPKVHAEMKLTVKKRAS